MKKKMWVLTCVLIMSVPIKIAVADVAADADTILNWGEKTYPQLLTNAETTKTADPWFYRYYAKTNLYVGINSQDGGVYTLYGTAGASPLFVGTLANLLALAVPTGVPVNPPIANDPTPPPETVPPEEQPQCDAASAPQGVAYVQAGNNLKITTNGQCVAFPMTDICLPKSPVAGGVSVLKSLDIQTYTLNGINFVTPAMAKIFEPQIKSAANIKTCIKNAPQSFASLNLSLDGCFDVTNQVKDFPSIAGLVKVAPPVTMQMQGNVSLATIADCFSTDASLITDALTHEVWEKKGGAFVKR